MSNAENLDKEILEPFQEIFAAMGISDNQLSLAAEKFSLPKLTDAERAALSEGMPIDPKILEELMKNLAPLVPFAYKEHAVLLYLRDQYLSQKNYEHGNYNRFHLCFCQTLRTAKKSNRYESRFVLTYDTSENFLVNLFTLDGKAREQNVYRRLKVCQHCLREINWKNFRRYCGAGRAAFHGGNEQKRLEIVENFDIAEYLLTAQKNSDFPPVDFTDVSAVKKVYELTPQIKAALKKNSAYICEVCRRNFPPEELQIHHKNHNQGDNRRDNLLVLCRKCHDKIHAAEGGAFVKKKNRHADDLKILGDIVLANGDKESAKNFYRRATNAYQKLSDLDALFELANLYLRDPKTLTAAQKHFQRYLSQARDGGDKEKIRCGLIYAKGLGVPKNFSKAQNFFDAVKSNEANFRNSEFIELVRLMKYVDSAEILRAQAIEIFEAAARSGDNSAVSELVKLYCDKNLGSDFDATTFDDDDNAIKIFLDDAEDLFGKEVASHDKIQRQFEDVKHGDWKLVSQLKILAKRGDSESQAVLEKLYLDAEQPNSRGVIVIREGVTHIIDKQFYNRRKITHVVFPETLTEIGNEAFRACGLKSLVLPAALKKIGEYAFQDSAKPVVEVTYHRRIEWRLREYFGARWESIKKTRLD